MAQAGDTEIITAIRDYLLHHPNASDGVDGIQRWWLIGSNASYERIASALEHLVELNVMLKHTLPDGSVVYSASR